MPDQKEIVDCLKAGGVILHRPDTIWGLSCDACNAEAVAKLSAIKARGKGKSYIVLVKNVAMMERHVSLVPEVAYDLIDASVQPLTIIYPEGIGLADGVCAEDGSVGIRVTDEHLSRGIIERLRMPIVSTSANISGQASPKNLSEVSPEIRDKVDLVVEREKAAEQSKPSTIIKLALNGEFSIIRP